MPFGRVYDRLQFGVESSGYPTCYLYRDGTGPALDIGIVARADARLMRGGLLRESEGFASRSYHAPQLAGIHDRMMNED